MENKKSFILYLDALGISDEMSDEDLGKFFRAIISYQKGESYDLPKDLKLAFYSFKKQFERDNEKWENIKKRNQVNGKKGGRPKTQNNPVGSLVTQDNPNNLVTDTVTDTVNVTVNNKKEYKEKDKSFPVLVEILNYFNEKTASKLKPTTKKRNQLKARLKLYSIDEIKKAISARTEIPFYKGQNKDGKIWYNDWNSLFRNDEKIEAILNNGFRTWKDWTDEEWDSNYNKIKSDKKRWLKENNKKLYNHLEIVHF